MIVLDIVLSSSVWLKMVHFRLKHQSDKMIPEASLCEDGL